MLRHRCIDQETRKESWNLFRHLHNSSLVVVSFSRDHDLCSIVMLPRTITRRGLSVAFSLPWVFICLQHCKRCEEETSLRQFLNSWPLRSYDETLSATLGVKACISSWKSHNLSNNFSWLTRCGRSSKASTVRGWKRVKIFMRSSWCLSHYVQLFSYNFKLCVFLFAPFGIHKMNTQISFPSVRFFLCFVRSWKNTFSSRVCLSNPTLTYFCLPSRQWHAENFHHRGKSISTQQRSEIECGEWKQ